MCCPQKVPATANDESVTNLTNRGAEKEPQNGTCCSGKRLTGLTSTARSWIECRQFADGRQGLDFLQMTMTFFRPVTATSDLFYQMTEDQKTPAAEKDPQNETCCSGMRLTGLTSTVRSWIEWFADGHQGPDFLQMTTTLFRPATTTSDLFSQTTKDQKTLAGENDPQLGPLRHSFEISDFHKNVFNF